MPITTPTTTPDLLRAVNLLLVSTGTDMVMSLETANMDMRAQTALALLGEASVTTQMTGWHFNEEYDYPLEPNTEGFIYLPANLGAFYVSARSQDMDVTQRGQRLYDLKARSYTFTAPVYADILLLFEFDEIPAPIRWYIIAQAGKDFGVNRAPDTSTYRFNKEFEAQALSTAQQFDQDARARSLTQSSGHFAKMNKR